MISILLDVRYSPIFKGMKQNKFMITLSSITGEQPFLSGNKQGKEVFHKLLGEIESHPGVAVFGISLKGIQATDASFPRESVISLIKMYSGEKAFFLSDFASDDLKDNWDYAAKAKKQAVIVHLDSRKYDVIGPELSDGIKELLNFVMEEGEVTSSAVAKHFEITAQNASAKMKKLFSMGLVTGSKETAKTGGLEFVYHAIK